MFKSINPKQNFPEQEEDIIKFWKDNNIFEKQVQSKPEGNKYVFYDGPPFITGLPHYGHLLGSISKDVIPRFHAMRGKRVERVWGWDCHGLPIENKVEKALNLKNRRDIESFGIGKFIDECYKYTREVSAEWDWYIDHIGRWVDMDHAYKTMDQDYMETVMWVFKQLHSKDIIYEGVRTSLFCTRCGTPVSNFEIAMDNSYADMEDPAITVKFGLKQEELAKRIEFSNEEILPLSILAWTTTPWTMPANRGLVINKDIDYALVKVQKLDIELEKSWLINELPSDLKSKKKSQITQAYLVNYKDPAGREVKDARIRKIDGQFEFTVKFNIGRVEETGELIEETKEITKEEYIDLIKTACSKTVKTRYYYPLEDLLVAEIDVYENNLKGFNVVEVEFSSLKREANFKIPAWFGKEVTDSDGVYPKYIAEKTLEEVIQINNEYNQKPHNYSSFAQNELVILAKKRIPYTLGSMDYEIIAEFKGSKLEGLEYSAPYDFFAPNENDWKIYHFEGMVSDEDGVGVVHSAPGFGEIDTEMGKHFGLTVMMNVNDEGRYVSEVTNWAGVYVKDADPMIIQDLKSRNLLFKLEKITHRYPFCYRCETPLIHKAQSSWFIDVQKIKTKLLKNNEDINWVPNHVKEGRFGKGLATAPDWGISRSRYWGTPMPVWEKRDNDGKIIERVIIGSRDELMERNDEITKIIFVRHGEADKKGEIDGGLNEKGIEQANNLTKLLSGTKIDAILSSSMLRCAETVTPIAKELGIDIKVDERFGSVARKQKLYEKKNAKNIEELKQGNEDVVIELLSDSIQNDKNTISEISEEYKGKTILICTHAEIISSFRYILEGGKILTYLKKQPKFGSKFTVYTYKGKLLDLHRPVIDDLQLKSSDGTTTLSRVDETLDVWMESASMPYAQKHYPFENKDDVEANFPADYISEYIAQTRAWFYVMHVISTALLDSNSFKNVVVSGVIMGNDGRKMSKSFGNYPDPKGVLTQYGGDALRMYLQSTPLLKGENVDINEDAIKGQLRDFILPLWNSYSFFLTYAEIHKWKPNSNTGSGKENVLDLWVLMKLQELIRQVTNKLEEYDIPGATKELPKFMTDLSKWYIRRSRDRFRDGDIDALNTLYHVLVEYVKVIAPFAPFVSESIYMNLVKNCEGSESMAESVHLCDYPKLDLGFIEKYSGIVFQMDSVREISALGQSVRVENGIKVRQPLAEVQVTIDAEDSSEKRLDKWMSDIIKEELNIKEVVEVSCKEDHKVGDGYISVEDSKMHIKITIDSNLTSDLESEGIYRELVRNIQAYRKQVGLKFGELVVLHVESKNQEIIDVVKKYESELKNDINVSKVELCSNDGDIIKVNDNEMKIKLIGS